MAQGPLFLERQSYRRRRMMDAIRLLPFLGLVVWMVPLLWPMPPEAGAAGEAGVGAGIRTSVTLKYLFGGWIALVLVGWLLWRRTRTKGTAAAPENAGGAS